MTFTQTRFETSNYELHWPILEEKNKKSNWTNERWIWWENKDRIWSIGTKKHSYLTDDNYENKKAKKGTKKCVIKQKLKIEDYKDC